MRAQIIRPGRRLLVAGAILVLLLTWTAVERAAAGDVSRKMEREISIMEELISDVLIESPYWLVSSGGPNYGIYIDGFGVIFNFEASLVSGRSYGGDWSLGRLFGLHGRKGRIIISDDDDYYWYDDEDEDEDEDEDADDDASAVKRWRSSREKRADRCYQRGKVELHEVLADAGDILSEMKDDDYVAIAAFLEDHRYFRKNKISRLFLKAKMRDLRAFQEKQITREQLEARVVEEVY